MALSIRGLAPAGVLAVALSTGCLTGQGPGQVNGTPGGAGENVVVVKDFEFVPANLEVKAGSTVTWKFEGPTGHSATSDPGAPESWDSGVLGTGKTFSRKFDKAGTFPYHCEPHPFMKATITVK